MARIYGNLKIKEKAKSYYYVRTIQELGVSRQNIMNWWRIKKKYFKKEKIRFYFKILKLN